jgi:8-oxo-dGTP pyrophosphatase MutT (NUDIX family)
VPTPAEPREPRLRQAVRAILLTPDHQVLLVRFEFPAGTRWALPGGGIDPGEEALDALRRELIEECGLHDPEIGPHVWSRTHVIPIPQLDLDGQHEQVHLVPVAAAFTPRPAFDEETLRAELVHELRWWHLEEIETSTAIFAPSTLGRRLRHLVVHGPPKAPLEVEV